jgi:hypothetical protein
MPDSTSIGVVIAVHLHYTLGSQYYSINLEDRFERLATNF